MARRDSPGVYNGKGLTLYTKNEKIVPIYIENEMKDSYINYAMSVIVGRALPDIRDGLKPVHRRILYAMKDLHLEHNKPYKKCARIVGECFVKDTLVATNKGLVSIQDIKRGDLVYTQKRSRRVTELYKMPPNELLEIKLVNGTSNTVTPAQKFKVLNKDFKFEWKEANKIDQNDYIVLRTCYPKTIKEIKLKRMHTLHPLYLNENLAYLLGLFISEGWITKNKDRKDTYRIGFSCNSPEIIERIASIIIKEFDYIPTIKESVYAIKKANGKTEANYKYTLRTSKNYIRNFFVENFNIAGFKAFTKKIPSQIFISPKSVIYAFISGLIDGDGSIHKNRCVVHYGSVSEELIDKMQILFQQLGIFSTKYITDKRGRKHFVNGREIRNKSKFYSLEFEGINAKLLSSKLNLYDLRKKERCKMVSGKAVKKSTFEAIPYAGEKIFTELSEKHRGGGWYTAESGQKFRSGVKYGTGCKIRYSKDLKEKTLRKSQIIEWGIRKKLEKIKSPLYDFVNHVISDNVYFMKVATITPIAPQVTYDIQVEGEHEFIANGMVSHNCLGKYHPHGDMAVYDSLVRMVQDFSLRYPLIDGQGNFGSVDGDRSAAQRYTEARFEHITDWMLNDIEKDTVRFVPNFDGSLEEPKILPATLPNLLVNGSSGIAVGMTTNIPPHNLTEIIDAICFFIDNPQCDIKDLMKNVKGPDFPTGGIITGRDGIKDAYTKGRGRILVNAKANTEQQKSGKESIVITEIPYQVNKSNLIQSIAALINDRKIEGISDLRDESDKDGMRIVIELKRGQNAEIILNQLYKHTQMRETFGVIMLALVDNRPRLLNLKEMISLYVDHRKEIVIRRTKYDLKKAEDRAHILEGLKIALKNLDRIIKIIKQSKDPQVAKTRLMDRFDLSDRQAQAILEMQLQRLTNLEREKIDKEYKELIKKIEILKGILVSEKKVLQIIKDESLDLKKRFGDERRTEIIGEFKELDIEDLIAEEDMVITISHAGYIRRLPISAYKKQKRGGKGVSGGATKEEDFSEHLFIASTHEYILFFTDKGKVYWLKVHEIPQVGRLAKGRAVINLLKLSGDEKITSFVPVKEFGETRFLVMATRRGIIKKVRLGAFKNPRKGGIIAISLGKEDNLISTVLTDGKSEVLLASKEGKAIRFREKDIRDMGRGAKGVRGIRLGKKDELIAMAVVTPDGSLLTVTENGFGKKTSFKEYRLQSRGGKGIINIKITKKNGNVIGLKSVKDSDEIMLITHHGMVVRTPVKGIRTIGRSTQGVRVIRLKDKDKVSSMASIVSEEG